MKEEEINDLIMELENCIFMFEQRKFWRASMLFKFFELKNSQDFRILINKVSEQKDNVGIHKKEELLGSPENVTDEILLSRSFCESLVKLIPEVNNKTHAARKYFDLYHCGIATIKRELLNN
jgi:hypothetical protein